MRLILCLLIIVKFSFSQVELNTVVMAGDMDLLISHVLHFKEKKHDYNPDYFYNKQIYDRQFQYKRDGVNGTDYKTVENSSFLVIDTGHFRNEKGEIMKDYWYLKTIKQENNKDTILIKIGALFDLSFELKGVIIPPTNYYCKDYLQKNTFGYDTKASEKSIRFEKEKGITFLYCERSKGPVTTKGVKIVLSNKKVINKPSDRSKVTVNRSGYLEYFLLALTPSELLLLKNNYIEEIKDIYGIYFPVDNKYAVKDYANCLQ